MACVFARLFVCRACDALLLRLPLGARLLGQGDLARSPLLLYRR
jgi:hypothetical protein